jgi:hypothetical protein
VTDQSEIPGTQPPPLAADGSPAAVTPVSSSSSSSAAGHSPAEIAAERPELAVGAAFAGGFLLAMILKRLAR